MDTIESAGFKKDAAGKVRMGGKLVSQDVAAQVEQGVILANFNLDDLRKSKARKTATGGKSLVEALNEISPAIGLLGVGMTAKIAMPQQVEGEKDPKRSFVMSVVTKLNHLTAKGREWAGKQFDSASDEAGEFLYVTRLEDTDNPKEYKASSGRKAKASKDNLQDALARSREHLNANGKDAVEATGEGEPVPDGSPAADHVEETSEEATVIQH